jgi:hypothetical protein
MAAEQPNAIMCAEATPWRCHRRLIADLLALRGWAVWDIMAAGKVEAHRVTEFARIVDGRLIYPGTPLFDQADQADHIDPDPDSNKGGSPCPRAS